MSDSFTLYKLIVLYMLEKVDFPLTNAQLADFMLDKGYTSYFTLQQALHELLDANLISVESMRNSSLYRITEEGNNTLEYFGNRISDVIRAEIDEYLQEKNFQLRNEVSVLADYYKTTYQNYEVDCLIREKQNNLMELKMTVTTETEAEEICSRWKEKSQDVYAYLMSELLYKS